MEISKEYAVQMRGIVKYFGTHKVLDHIDLDVKKGETHAILGENGAGKSTLMNILYGMYNADYGSVYLNGELVNIKNPSVAISRGIGMVHQHFMLIDKFTVLQNIILGNEITGKFGVINFRKAKHKVVDIIKKYDNNNIESSRNEIKTEIVPQAPPEQKTNTNLESKELETKNDAELKPYVNHSHRSNKNKRPFRISRIFRK